MTQNDSPPDPESARAGNDRPQWRHGIEFLMSCIAMSAGLGNVWRFPFIAYENGGGAFLLAYVIVLTVFGRPMYYLEMCLGQFSSRGNVKAFEAMVPAMKGIGYGQVIACFSIATYYCSLMALTVFFFINSFTGDLPWAQCRDEWTSDGTICIPSKSPANEALANGFTSSELYFKREVLKEIKDISDGTGEPEWRLALCLLGSWVVTFFFARNGVSSSGKASYFFAIFPYVILITLLGRAVTLEGAKDGIRFFIEPNWETLKGVKVWYAAITQCFFTLNVGMGTIIVYSSYNDFNHNIYRDAFVVAGTDILSSLLAGFTVFGILGHLGFKKGVKDIREVIKGGGTALAFISYPEAIAMFDAVPWLFAVLFFLMLFVLGLGSLVALILGSAFSVITDTFPTWKKWHVTLGCCITGFLIGIVYVTPGGQHIVTLVDYFAGVFIVYVLTTLEVVTVFWWYGLENFCNDMEFMLKKPVGIYWRLTWGLITPVILIVIFVYSMVTLENLQHEGDVLSDDALAAGWVIVGVAFAQIIIWWAYYIHHNRKVYGIEKSFKKSIGHEKWGPQDAELRKQWELQKTDLALRRSKVSLPIWKEKLFILIGKKFY